jgi:molecular chaperone GrpE (heat shock protein)
MSDHTHREEEEERQAARHVRVTDKRRVHHADGPAEPNDQAGERDLGAPDTQGQPAPVVGVAGPAGSREELEVARKQAAEYLEHLQRLKAEFDNYRKRVLKEQTRAVEMASEPLLRRLLEVLDEFELALMAAEQKPDFDRFLHGVELVYAKLQEILRSEGLERIDAKGKPFDPEQHEALMQSGDGDGEPRVADVLRNGYSLRGRVIRPAGVKVVRK